jgi:hypothetical protein
MVSNGTRHHRAADAALLEAEWQEQVEQYAELCGWTYYHTRDSRGSHSGFPDLILIRRQGEKTRMIAAELKREHEDCTPEQEAWLDLMAAYGVETYVWRPSNFEGMTRVLR